jgi:hypothetical protein
VPRDATPAIGINDGSSIQRAFKILGATARGVHRCVFEQQDGVVNGSSHASSVKVALQFEGVQVVNGARKVPKRNR